MSWNWLASLRRLRAAQKHGPIVIQNPWAEGIIPAHIELIREGARAFVREVFLAIDSGPYSRKEKELAHLCEETYREVVFVAGCRLWALDGEKEYTHSLWLPHLKVVQDMVLEQLQHLVPAGGSARPAPAKGGTH
jgi:hypothetical protein